MMLSVRATQGRPGPSGGGLAWAIFGNAFSVEEDKEQGTKELFVRKDGRILEQFKMNHGRASMCSFCFPGGEECE